MKSLVPMTMSLGLMATTAFAEGNGAKGEKVFEKCTATSAVWDGPALSAYLENPEAIVAGIKMALSDI
jgi:cytochrome c2